MRIKTVTIIGLVFGFFLSYRSFLTKSKLKKEYLVNQQLVDSFEKVLSLQKMDYYSGEFKKDRILVKEIADEFTGYSPKDHYNLCINASEVDFLANLNQDKLLGLFHHLKSQSTLSNGKITMGGFKTLTNIERVEIFRNRILLIHLCISGLISEKINPNVKFEFLNLIERHFKKSDALRVIYNKKNRTNDNTLDAFVKLNCYQIVGSEMPCNCQKDGYGRMMSIGHTFPCNKYQLEGSRLIDLNERELEIAYLTLLYQPEKLIDYQLDTLTSHLENSQESLRLLRVYFEKLSRSKNDKPNFIKITELMNDNSKVKLNISLKTFQEQLNNYVQKNLTDSQTVVAYCNLLVRNGSYEEARQLISKINNLKLKNELEFIVTLGTKGVVPAFDALMVNNFGSKEMNAFTSKYIKPYSESQGKNNLSVIKEIGHKYPNIFDSINLGSFTSVSNVNKRFSGGHEFFATFQSMENAQMAISLLRRSENSAVADYIELSAWTKYCFNNNYGYAPCAISVGPRVAAFCRTITYANNQCNQIKRVVLDSVEYPLKNYKEFFQIKLIPQLKSTYCYDEVMKLKALGDAYYFIGEEAKRDFYYNEAKSLERKNELEEKARASRATSQYNGGAIYGGGGRTIITGKRGGKYYMNGNGNKTYIRSGRKR
jgi:hypothetical protein